MPEHEHRRVYKFYPARWGLDALYRRRLKVTTDHDINDPFEFLATGPNRNKRRFASEFRKRFFSEDGIISFSEIWSEPLLWSHYAEKHSGIAIGFDLAPFTGFSVEYHDKRVPLPESDPVEYQFGERLRFFENVRIRKYAAWKYEREVRVFPELDACVSENGIYFKDFADVGDIREVVLGSEYSGGKNQRLMDELEGEGVSFTSARLSFNDFRVVKQRNKKLQRTL